MPSGLKQLDGVYNALTNWRKKHTYNEKSWHLEFLFIPASSYWSRAKKCMYSNSASKWSRKKSNAEQGLTTALCCFFYDVILRLVA